MRRLEEHSASARAPVGDAALRAIWGVVAALPRGVVDTYGGIARRAGLAGRARLVGHALRVAPDDLDLPWHRVVGAGGRIAFPAGSRSHREQCRRLRAEGLEVRGGRVRSGASALDALLFGGDC
jgi:methylated-DNA-protein-cysteine methyltransferase related protein